jgi:aerobic-type carbon monoxide dehydrogenase small subunit (CoxS/CutS family)
MNIALCVNGREHRLEVRAGDLLLHVLRGQGYHGVKHGCETGECGACVVLLDGRPAASCLVLAAQADGADITTIEGLAPPGSLHPLQQAFLDAGGIQCGFCAPAMVLVAHALLARNPHPTEADVREALSGVLCRCTGYAKTVQAVMRAAASRAEGASR